MIITTIVAMNANAQISIVIKKTLEKRTRKKIIIAVFEE
jgi:hypothetical protein